MPGTETEKYVRYAASVPSMTAAFEFVMRHLDEFDQPQVEIRPRMTPPPPGQYGEDWTLQFEVTIGGLVTP